MDAGRHPLIEVLTCSRVIGVEGRAGAFRARVRTEPRYVRADRCVACGLCSEACPQVGGNAFDVGLKARKAIFRPFPQSVPATYLVDPEACLNFQSFLSPAQRAKLDRIKKAKARKDPSFRTDFLVCDHCSAACGVGAIDFDEQPRERVVEAGAILVAVGFQEVDARALGPYGYGRLPDVITTLELERMLNASGPTRGHVVRPSDHATPRRIAFVQCAGARGEGGRVACSRTCCMNAVKDALLIRQHDPEVESVSILHTDIRAFGRGYDDFVERARAQGAATWIRGRASRIVPGEAGALVIQVEDAARGAVQVEADLVVLSMAAAPNDGAAELAAILELPLDREGFLAREDPAVSCVETGREGVYVCGSAVGPQVIPDCVAQGSAAAARAGRFLAGARQPETPSTVIPRDASGPARVGVIVCHCGVNIGGVLGVDALVEGARALPGVVVAEPSLFACSATGQEDLARLVDEHALNRVVVAACTPRTHEPVFRETLARVGMNPYLLEMANIRDQCSWVHAHQPEAAQRKAQDLVRMGVARARHLEPLAAGRAPVTRAALVIGGGIAGIQAATDLAEQGFPVTLVERSARLGGRLADLHQLYPNRRAAADVLARKVARLHESGARVLTGTEVREITGFVGSFQATFAGASQETLPVGAIVLAFGADLFDPAGVCGYGRLAGVLTGEELERELAAGAPLPRSAAFLLCVGSREPGVAGCSRYCCPSTVKQALALARAGVDTTVLYRDLRLVSSGAEGMAREAREAGVLFVHVEAGTEPEPVGEERIEALRVRDDLSGRELLIPAERLVLATGMRPRRAETALFHDLLKASVALDGFFLERHPELAPVETAVEGVFLAGTVQGPKDVVDTVAQASAAAAKAAVILAAEGVRLDPAVAMVDELRCRACGKCVEICRYTAPSLATDAGGWTVARVNASLCKGCGTCAAWCPSGAITARHFTDRQVLAMVDALFQEAAP